MVYDTPWKHGGGGFVHAQTVDTKPLFPPPTWPGYEANSNWMELLLTPKKLVALPPLKRLLPLTGGTQSRRLTITTKWTLPFPQAQDSVQMQPHLSSSPASSEFFDRLKNWRWTRPENGADTSPPSSRVTILIVVSRSQTLRVWLRKTNTM